MIFLIQFLSLLSIAVQLSACPTCIGRVTHSSAPFFSKEFYKKEFSSNSKHVFQKNSIQSNTNNNTRKQS